MLGDMEESQTRDPGLRFRRGPGSRAGASLVGIADLTLLFYPQPVIVTLWVPKRVVAVTPMMTLHWGWFLASVAAKNT